MSSAERHTRTGDVLAREQVLVCLSIRRQPASEMERSGIELHCGEKFAVQCEAESSCTAE